MALHRQRAFGGDTTITDMLPPEIETMRQNLRARLIAARSNSYTYRDPDAIAKRVGATIGSDGTIVIKKPAIIPVENARGGATDLRTPAFINKRVTK